MAVAAGGRIILFRRQRRLNYLRTVLKQDPSPEPRVCGVPLGLMTNSKAGTDRASFIKG
jgi:hypothetical protein